MARRRGDEMPGWIADKQKRLAKIREAREALGRRPQLPRRRKPKPNARRRRNARRENRERSGPVPRPPSKEPDPEAAQLTDPDSRVLLTKDGFIQGTTRKRRSTGPSKSSWRMDGRRA